MDWIFFVGCAAVSKIPGPVRGSKRRSVRKADCKRTSSRGLVRDKVCDRDRISPGTRVDPGETPGEIPGALGVVVTVAWLQEGQSGCGVTVAGGMGAGYSEDVTAGLDNGCMHPPSIVMRTITASAAYPGDSIVPDLQYRLNFLDGRSYRN